MNGGKLVAIDLCCGAGGWAFAARGLPIRTAAWQSLCPVSSAGTGGGCKRRVGTGPGRSSAETPSKLPRRRRLRCRLSYER